MTEEEIKATIEVAKKRRGDRCSCTRLNCWDGLAGECRDASHLGGPTTAAQLAAALLVLYEWRLYISAAIKRTPEFGPGQWAGDKEGWGYHHEIVNFMHRDRAKLQARVAELNAAMVKLSNELPYPEEIKGWTEQRAKMIAEVGTLRAELSKQVKQRNACIKVSEERRTENMQLTEENRIIHEAALELASKVARMQLVVRALGTWRDSLDKAWEGNDRDFPLITALDTYRRTIGEQAEPIAWVVVDLTHSMPSDEGRCEYMVTMTEGEANRIASEHRERLWSTGCLETEAACDAAVQVVPLVRLW